MKNIICFVMLISSITTSSIFWKISSIHILRNTSEGNSWWIKYITNGWYILGWFFYLLATFLWMYLLGKYEYSKLYPIYVGVSIVVSLIAGLIFLKENTDMLYKVIGAVLIICGTIFITKHS